MPRDFETIATTVGRARPGLEIRVAEVQFHHEVTNQFLWSQF